MSVVGEMASIAGLASLAGQASGGLSKIYSLATSYKSIPQKAQHLADDCRSLQKTLAQVQNVASRAAFKDSCLAEPEPINALYSSVSRCQGTIAETVEKIKAFHPSGTSSRWKRIKVVAMDDFFVEIHSHIVSAREDLLLHLNTLNL